MSWVLIIACIVLVPLIYVALALLPDRGVFANVRRGGGNPIRERGK